MQFLKKITAKGAGLDVIALEKAATENRPKITAVLRVVGVVNDRKAEMSDLGPYARFIGQFAAVNLLTKEEYRAPSLILPSVAEAAVDSLFSKAAKDGGVAEIALDVLVEYNESSKGGRKYRYCVKPLVEFKGDDPLSRMLLALPAPPYVRKHLVG